MSRLHSATVLGAALLALTSVVLADSIDDAEAKRRGVPVAQVIAERQLETEKAKTAALQKQIADLQKKIADLKAAGGGGTAAATGTAPAGGGSAGGGVAAGPVAGMGIADTPLNFDGPRAASPLYDDFVKRYMDGDWDTLAADLEAKKKEIGALPAGNAADLTYIGRAVAEGKPAWWDGVRTGKTTQFRQLVWKQPVPFIYRNGSIAQTVNLDAVNGEFTPTVQWPRDAMDARDVLQLPEAGLNVPGDFGFLRRDATNWAVWQVIGNGGAMASAGGEKAKGYSQEDKLKATYYALFWQNVTAGYYGTPAARRMTCAMSLASFEPGMNGNANWVGRRPLGAALLLELGAKKDLYKEYGIETILGLDRAGGASGQMEAFIASPVMLKFVHTKLTFEQDRHIRELIKTLATTNSNWEVTKLTLARNQAYELDPSKDGPLADARVKAYVGGEK